MIAETPRPRVRGLTTDDAEFILGLVNQPLFLANIVSIGFLEKLGMRCERMVEMSEDDPGTALHS
jgi:hypothetical protein